MASFSMLASDVTWNKALPIIGRQMSKSGPNHSPRTVGTPQDKDTD
jgi:hypothetical protein